MSNRYTKKLESKSTEYLKGIISNHTQYQDALVEAAHEELQNRNVFSEEGKVVLKNIETKKEERLSRKKVKQPFPHPDLPQTIKVAAYLFYLSAVLYGIFNFYTVEVSITGTSRSVSYDFTFLILLLIAYYIHRGDNTTRWIVTVLFGLGSVLKLINLISGFYLDFYSLLFLLIDTAGVVLLFLEPSRKWYSRDESDEKEEEFIFPD